MHTYFWSTGWAIIEQVNIKVTKVTIKGIDISEFVAHFQINWAETVFENKKFKVTQHEVFTRIHLECFLQDIDKLTNVVAINSYKE